MSCDTWTCHGGIAVTIVVTLAFHDISIVLFLFLSSWSQSLSRGWPRACDKSNGGTSIKCCFWTHRSDCSGLQNTSTRAVGSKSADLEILFWLALLGHVLTFFFRSRHVMLHHVFKMIAIGRALATKGELWRRLRLGGFNTILSFYLNRLVARDGLVD